MSWFRRDEGSNWIGQLVMEKSRLTKQAHLDPEQTVDPWTKPDVWGVEVAGVQHHKPAIEGLIHRSGGPDNRARTMDAVLIPEPANPADANAIRVFLESEHVGYVPRDTAAKYQHDLMTLARLGEFLRVPGWLSVSDSYSTPGEHYIQFSLTMPQPDGVLPVNPFPEDDYRVVPAGRSLKVAGTDDHTATLARYLRPSGEAPIAVTLHPTELVRSRSTVEVVEVKVDGSVVGSLSPVASKQMLPLVSHMRSLGWTVVSRATVRGTTLRCDVYLRCSRSQDVPAAWLERLGRTRAAQNR